MVLILSENSDHSTSEVMQWLEYYGEKTVRINIEDQDTSFFSYDIEKQEMIIETEGKQVSTKDIDAIWYRRGGVPLRFKTNPKERLKGTFTEPDIFERFRTHINEEARTVKEFIHYFLDQIDRQVGSWHNSSVNKLIVLHKATKLGIDVPASFVSSNRTAMQNYKQEKGRVITKAISDGVFFENNEIGYISYTEDVEDEVLEEMPEQSFPSLLQERLDKAYELRVFYLCGKFYAMAIFSQLDAQTETDFRKYNHEKPNRFVPYQLPKEEEEKLDKLMKDLNLQTGSIDIVVTKDQRYVFLEVNPVGQIGMLDFPCNYGLYKIIAQKLIDLDKN